ncbi:MAG: hypothetical protein V3V78_01050 [Candidatus Woesearchaeota archaeon]
MKPSELFKSVKDYLKEVYFSKSKEIPDGIQADLHVHPYITDKESLEHTLQVMDENGLDLIALTTHGKGGRYEHDFWRVKELAKAECDVEDKGRLFTVNYNGKELNFIPGYEMYVTLEGVKGRIDMVSLMSEEGFVSEVEVGMNFKDYQKISDKYDAVLTAAHPYTIWDPWPLPFRLAKEEERNVIKEKIFSEVDSVDLVATNALWMHISDSLVEEDYEKPLTNSDVHGKNRYARQKMGCSRNIFRELDFNSDKNLRKTLITSLNSGDFENYHNHLSPMQFFVQLCMGKKPIGFP